MPFLLALLLHSAHPTTAPDLSRLAAELIGANPQAARQREMQSCMLPLHIAAANRADEAALAELQRSGRLVCLASKNDEADVRDEVTLQKQSQ